MSNEATTVNSIAPLTNVSLASAAMDQAINRAESLPGIVCLYGPSGYGKSKAAAYIANKNRAYYIEGKSIWHRKSYLVNILRDMGIMPEKTMDLMLEQICEQLILSGRPLIIDEADYLVDKGYAQLLMDIHEGSSAPILVIGEERLPSKLKRRHEKVHNRVLDWAPAQPADIKDCRHLAKLYATGIKVADDLMEHIRHTVSGCTRRVTVNLNRVRREALSDGTTEATLTWWGDRELYTGEAPARRV